MTQVTPVTGSGTVSARIESPANAAPRSGFAALPLWARLQVSIALILIVVWSLMIFLTYQNRSEGAITEAEGVAQSVNQMTVSTITAMMITGVSKEREVFLDQVKNSNNVNDIRVFR